MTVQSGNAIPSTLLELLLTASLPTKIVVGILAVLSLISWAVILAKWIEFDRARVLSEQFLKGFGKFTRLEQALAYTKKGKPNAYTRIVSRAATFLQEIKPLSLEGGEVRTRLNAAQIDALHLVLNAEFTAERDRLGTYVPSLAVIGSASPLLGLFGTVLGVIAAFTGIAKSGAGNLAAVAPGVAEALIATAAALAVAVPAVFAYNVFAAKLNRIDGQLDGFGAELIALLAREGRI